MIKIAYFYEYLHLFLSKTRLKSLKIIVFPLISTVIELKFIKILQIATFLWLVIIIFLTR